MRRLLVLLSMALISLIVPPPASADNNFVLISETSHRGLDGVFLNDELATALKPEERLGNLVYTSPKSGRSWIIDIALVDEVIAMSNGYEVAKPLDKTKRIQNAKRYLVLEIRLQKLG